MILRAARGRCGVGFIADIKGRKSHQIVEDALAILVNLEHRGAVGADPRAGDGAGILVQTPHAFFKRKAAELGIALPEPGTTRSASCSCRTIRNGGRSSRTSMPRRCRQEGLTLLGWREVPSDNSSLGESVKPTEPFHMQVFIGRGEGIRARRTSSSAGSTSCARSISDVVYRKRERRLANYYVVSMSCRTVIYKGMFLADQLGNYYPDLHEPDFESALGAGASALLDQHVPDLVAGASVPHDRA